MRCVHDAHGRPFSCACRPHWSPPELDNVRKAGHWLADHHMQVGAIVSNALASRSLDRAEALMHDYASCYETRNELRAGVLAGAGAGQYPTPGD